MADIFRRYGPPYRAKYGDRMLPSHRQAMGAIERCRTLALGGHVYACEACGETQYQYHSCRNRHCPKCQNGKAQLWLEKQQVLLLPVPHFLVTVTLPSELRRVARSHQKLVYDLFFRTPAAAMQHLARDPRFVGGQMGMVGVVDICSPFVVSPEGVALGNEIPDSMVMVYPDEQVEKFGRPRERQRYRPDADVHAEVHDRRRYRGRAVAGRAVQGHAHADSDAGARRGGQATGHPVHRHLSGGRAGGGDQLRAGRRRVWAAVDVVTGSVNVSKRPLMGGGGVVDRPAR